MNNWYYKFFILLLALIFIGSCSHKQMYEVLQIKQQNDCLKLPQSEYESCMESTEKPYEQYKEERQEMKNK